MGARQAFDAPVAPDQPFVAIGDIHGRDDLLSALLAQIEQEAPDLPLIFVGDYVDRGPDSVAVLRRVMELCQSGAREAVALMGNHEAMLLEFLDLPDNAGPRWLFNGGDRTLDSAGIEPPADHQDQDALRQASGALADLLGSELIGWLRCLPLAWQSGNVAVTHAGGHPAHPIEPRRGHGLLWGHPEFLRKTRQDGLWMVHGHFIVPAATASEGRISIDTGAYSTGRLSAAIVTPGQVRFLTT